MNKINPVFELQRKIVHILVGSIFVVLIFFNFVEWWFFLILFIIGIILSLLSRNYKLPLLSALLSMFERPHLLKKFSGKGLLFIVLSAMILQLTTTKEVASASLMIWTFGDSMTAIIGIYFLGFKPESIKNPLNKSRVLIGTLIGVLAATIASTPFVGFLASFLASFVSLSIESLESKLIEKYLDDNLVVPLIAAIVIEIVFLFS